MFIRLMLLLLLLNSMDIFFKDGGKVSLVRQCWYALDHMEKSDRSSEMFRKLVQHEVLSAVVIVVSSIWVRSMMVVIDSSVRFVANMRVSLW